MTILLYFFIIPLQIAFDINCTDKFHSYLLSLNMNYHLTELIVLIPEILLVLDTFLKFITGYYENGLVITSKTKIIEHYLKKGLIFDLLSYCPILAQSIFSNNSMILKIMQLLLFLKFKRIRIIISNFQEIISLQGQNDYILSLLLLVFQTIFFAHINACIWHTTAYYYVGDSNTLTWLDYSNTKDISWVSRYLYSIFWAISVLVTIGYGEKVSPQNDTELCVGTLIFLASALFFGYTINAMREIFTMMNENEKNFK